MGIFSFVNGVPLLTAFHYQLSIVLIQLNFNGSNTDGLFTMAVSNSFLSSLEKKSIAADLRQF